MLLQEVAAVTLLIVVPGTRHEFYFSFRGDDSLSDSSSVGVSVCHRQRTGRTGRLLLIGA